MGRLIFLAGPPGVGKSTVARMIFAQQRSIVWLDGDDVWRIKPFVVNDRTRAQVEGNIVAVLRGHLQAGFDNVLLTWVLHRQDLVERLVERIGHPLDVHIALVCAPEELIKRRRSRGEDDRHEHALRRLEQVRQTQGVLLDTTDKSPAVIAEEIGRRWLG